MQLKIIIFFKICNFVKRTKMKNIFPLFILIAVIISSTSCQKELSATLPPINAVDSSGLLKTYTEGYPSIASPINSLTFNVQYGGNKQIIGLISASNPANRFVFTYPLPTKYTQDILAADTLMLHEDFYTNSNGFLDSTYQYNDTKDTSSEKYFYNSNNQVITMNEYQFNKGQSELINTINYTYNIDGDLETATGSDLNKETYTYYTDAAYVSPLVLGIININSFKKMHLVKTSNLTSNGMVIISVNYTYTFDAQNRIVTELANGSDGSRVTKAYTYY